MGPSEGQTQEISDLWQQKESLQIHISRTVILPGDAAERLTSLLEFSSWTTWLFMHVLINDTARCEQEHVSSDCRARWGVECSRHETLILLSSSAAPVGGQDSGSSAYSLSTPGCMAGVKGRLLRRQDPL